MSQVPFTNNLQSLCRNNFTYITPFRDHQSYVKKKDKSKVKEPRIVRSVVRRKEETGDQETSP